MKKWTKSVDIFKKKYIIVPINESFHWYTAVIVNPSNILRRAQTEMSRRATTSISPADGNAAASDSGGAQERMSSTLVEGDESRDELDIITDMEEGAVAQGVGMIGDSMDRMSIDGDKPQASPPRPIVSATYEAFVDQLSLRSRSQSGSPSKGASGRKVCKEVDIVNSDR